MTAPTPEALAGQFTLRIDRRRLRGRAGESLGAGLGSSLEFQDFREYVPGDDVRHLDWAAYARRDELVVRLHREEITPSLEILLDESASMASTPEKRSRVLELVRLLVDIARQDRFRPRLWCLGETTVLHERDDAIRGHLADWNPQGPAGLETLALRPPRLGPRSLRVLISDLLFPGEVAPLVRNTGRQAAGLVALQVLNADEDDPGFRGGTRLEDVEGRGALDLVISDEAVQDYRRRLAALRESWSRALRRQGGALAIARDDSPLADIAAGPLRHAGLLAVRGSAEAGG